MPGEKGESPQGVSAGMEVKKCVWGGVVSAGERRLGSSREEGRWSLYTILTGLMSSPVGSGN